MSVLNGENTNLENRVLKAFSGTRSKNFGNKMWSKWSRLKNGEN